MSAAASPGRRRLLIAASTLVDAEAALRLAHTILERGRLPLAGLFTDTTNAGRNYVAGQRIVSGTGALLPVPTPESAGRIARSEARAFRQRLAEFAEAHAIEWSLETRGDEIVAAACAASTEEDILLFGQRPLRRRAGRVMLVAMRAKATNATRALAEAVARSGGTEVDEVAAGAEAGREALLARLDRCAASVVVADFAAGPLRNRDDLRRLLAAARCPVVVLGAAALRAAAGPEKDR